MHLAWMCKLYLKQASTGRRFLHEHPADVTSWNEPCVLEVLQHRRAARVKADQCKLRQEAENSELVRKPTGAMSNCEDILDQLHRPKGGVHQLCNGKTARRAAIFQRELCEGVLIWLRNYLTRHRRMKNNEHFALMDLPS